VANELVILIRPQLHDDTHCAAALSVHVSHSLPPHEARVQRRAGGKVANILTALRPTSPMPAARSVLNPTLARLERDFVRAIHNTQESGAAIKRRLLDAKRRPGTEASEITPSPGPGRR
jgi:hypothetical protein